MGLITVCHLYLYIVVYGLVQFDVSANTNMKEYCHVDTFQPVCPDNEIVIVTHGVFGRMKTGRCVKIANNLGCSKDVQDFLNSKCSGRKSCTMPVTEVSVHAQLKCLQEMHAYLEANYICQKIFTPPIRQCSSPLVIESTGKSQFISSVISRDTSCGMQQTPYILEAKPGQTIQVILHDYSVLSGAPKGSCATKYGYIMDTSNDDVVNLCGGVHHKNKVLKSSDRRVQILLERAAVTNFYFLIEFKAIGCPDITQPKYAWMKKVNGTITIGCHTSEDKWTMKCVGNIWLGILKECPAPVITTSPTKNFDSKDNKPHEQRDSTIPHVSDNHLFAIGIGCMTIVICVTTVVLGFHCVKRYELSMQKKTSFNMSTLNHNTGYKPVVNNGTLPSFNTGFPLYTLDRDANAPELPRRTSSMMEQANETNPGTPDYFNLLNIGREGNQEKIYQSIPREGPLLT